LASTWPTEVSFLRDLVAIPSISGNEAGAAEFVAEYARRAGLDVAHDETSVRVSVGDEAAGPTLVLASHLDVVPPGDGWTRDPFVPVIEGDRLYGRGSGDAKASVSAMIHALIDFAQQGTARKGRLLAVFTYGEETRNATMPAAVARAGRLDAAIVGEPTNLQLAIAQRGLMMVDLVARGDQHGDEHPYPYRRHEQGRATLLIVVHGSPLSCEGLTTTCELPAEVPHTLRPGLEMVKSPPAP